ncbi:MAG: 2-hydroxy-6-oxo-2,4-heptadienoate hydrolase, partial [Candidatus Pelagibacter sp.]|nr:2-hydroxy-6-oxo-2,4-heptadienoate hydrolase [Candidatus Pelagibacter sp.]
MRVFILFLVFFNFFFSAQSSQKNILNNLFDQLGTANNPKTAEVLERKIWSVWNKHPNNIKLTEKLEFGIELMQYGDYNYALKVFNNVLESDPKWFEAWNK